MRQPQPHESLRACLSLTRCTVAQLATAAGVPLSRLRSGLAGYAPLTPDEIARCHGILQKWLIGAVKAEADGRPAPVDGGDRGNS